MRYPVKIAIPILLLFTAVCGLQSESTGQESLPKSDKGANASAIVPNAIFPAVVAKVNGDVIHGRDLEDLVRNELSSIGSPEWKNLRGDYRAELTLNKITALINSRLLYQEAKASGVKTTDAEIRAELQKIIRKYKNESEMDAVLAAQGKSRSSLERSLREDLIASKYVDATINKKIVVTSEEVEEYYSIRREQFRHPDIVRTSHILIKAAEKTSGQETVAREHAESVLARLNKGEDFARLARQYSMDPSASDGGDIGFSTKEALIPEYSDAAFSLPVGGIQMVRTPHGYHIIKVTDRKKEGQFTLDELRQQLVELIKNRKSQEELDKLITQLREKANIEILISAKELLNP